MNCGASFALSIRSSLLWPLESSAAIEDYRRYQMERWTAAEFESRYQELVRRLDSGSNDDCVECTRCVACARSTFCREGERLVGCHYCVSCKACTDCSHCQRCERLVGCTHCVISEDCTASSYLVHCRAMSNCTYCFGCIGLSSKDFYILNQPYSRQDYFRITGELSRTLRLGA